MKTRPVLLVVPPRPLLLDIAGPAEVLRRANMVEPPRPFELRFVSPSRELVTSVGLPIGPLEQLPNELPPGVIVIVVGAADTVLGAAGPRESDAERDLGRRAIVGWLRDVVAPSLRSDGEALIVSICSGALLLGEAGLLHRRHCTTHFGMLEDLARAAPTATVFADRLFVEDGAVWTSAGVTAGIDLTLHLVSRLCGPAVASDAAKHLVVYLRRSGGDPQLSPWLEGRNHLHPAVHLVQDAICAAPGRDWTVAELAGIAAASERTLSRLFRQNVGTTIPGYVNRLRATLAAEMLAHSGLGLEQVAERCGFGSARQLRRVFAQHHAASPSVHRANLRQAASTAEP
ncbi:GlxA family transcriptional regulator [Aurantimonas sp. VKM B-3413]|uniref:GlxA family transcriptional regulator n=1 Tax=Aurantimonas sp. VKM B-3413 TaxID=2779401 RepID=UPI001E4D8D34|nr:helix-turn-helix domain-containing protein [Aurantimonas sp. VKM B-3413]MCB8840110.1 helix-turn-helix domain-containing protein [Aurantimonas sp. VKM B-3413]